MKTNSTAAQSAAIEAARAYAMRGDGNSLTSDAARIRSFDLCSLKFLAGTIWRMREELLNAEDHPSVKLPRSESFDVPGIDDLNPAELFIEELGVWFASLGNIIEQIITDAEPTSALEASSKFVALIARAATFAYGSNDLLEIAQLALDGAAEAKRLESIGRYSQPPSLEARG